MSENALTAVLGPCLHPWTQDLWLVGELNVAVITCVNKMSSSSPSSIARYLHRLCDNSLNTGIFETETVERLLTLTLDASNVDEAAELEQAYDKVRKIFSNMPVMISTVFSNPRCKIRF